MMVAHTNCHPWTVFSSSMDYLNICTQDTLSTQTHTPCPATRVLVVDIGSFTQQYFHYPVEHRGGRRWERGGDRREMQRRSEGRRNRGGGWGDKIAINMIYIINYSWCLKCMFEGLLFLSCSWGTHERRKAHDIGDIYILRTAIMREGGKSHDIGNMHILRIIIMRGERREREMCWH